MSRSRRPLREKNDRRRQFDECSFARLLRCLQNESGYGDTEAEGGAVAVIIISMLLELMGELLTDSVAIRAESAHGVPVLRYFEMLANPWFVLVQMGALVCATGDADGARASSTPFGPQPHRGVKAPSRRPGRLFRSPLPPRVRAGCAAGWSHTTGILRV